MESRRGRIRRVSKRNKEGDQEVEPRRARIRTNKDGGHQGKSGGTSTGGPADRKASPPEFMNSAGL